MGKQVGHVDRLRRGFGMSEQRMKNKEMVVALAGEHELYSAARLRPRLEALLADGHPVVVDMRRATFVDSATVNVLIDAKRRADALGLDFSLLIGPETGASVRRLFALTTLDEVLPIRDEGRDVDSPHGVRRPAAGAARVGDTPR